MVTVEVIKQPPKVVYGIEDVGKNIAPIPKVATAVTTHEKLTVVPLPTISKVAATISELSTINVVKADIVKDVVEEVVPLSGLNMQLKMMRTSLLHHHYLLLLLMMKMLLRRNPTRLGLDQLQEHMQNYWNNRRTHS
jgi:hypothetical protein